MRKDFDLVYELTTRMCADIYMKAFVDSGKWESACELINIIDPSKLQKLITQRQTEDAEAPNGTSSNVPVPNQGGSSSVAPPSAADAESRSGIPLSRSRGVSAHPQSKRPVKSPGTHVSQLPE